MGIDVFGRNTFGGGGFRSDIALKAAYQEGGSCTPRSQLHARRSLNYVQFAADRCMITCCCELCRCMNVKSLAADTLLHTLCCSYKPTSWLLCL